MPTIEIPIRDVSEVVGLRKNRQFQADARELIRLTDEIKRLNDRAAELRLGCYDHITRALNGSEEKSVGFDGYRLSAFQGEGRRTLDKAKLLKVIPAAKLAKCYTVGEKPRPTVSVSKVKER